MNALVPVADGVEEIEAVTVVDTLRRAEWQVTLAGVGSQTITASRGVRLVADQAWEAVDPADYGVLVLPGGGGNARTLAGHAGILDAVRSFCASGRTVAAICAAPRVLQAAGVLEGRTATAYPAVRGDLAGAHVVDQRVVVDGRLITSQGPGTALEFALTLVRELDSPDKAEQLAEEMIAG